MTVQVYKHQYGNTNGLLFVFPSSLQMADCGGMPQVDQVCMSVSVFVGGASIVEQSGWG